MIPRRAQRRDANEAEIIAALRARGASVAQGGPLDILVGYRKKNFLLEIKSSEQPPSGQTLTDAERTFIRSWKGQVAVVFSVVDAISIVFGPKAAAAESRDERKRMTARRVDATIGEANELGKAYREIHAPNDKTKPARIRPWGISRERTKR